MRISPPSASASAAGSLLVTVDGLSGPDDPTRLTAPTDVHEASATPPKVTFGTPLALPPSGQQRRWVLPFSVSGMPPGAELTRYFSFKLGAADWTLAYQLSSPLAPAPSWSLKPLPVPVRTIAPGDPLPLSVNISGSLPVTGIRAAPVELIEQGTKRKFAAGRLVLCPTPAVCEGGPFQLEGSGMHSVWLVPRLAADDHVILRLRPGKYDGAVTLSSSDKPAGESVNLALHVTSWEWQLGGFVLILAGILAAWYFTSFIRQRLARDQMLMPAVMLRSDIDKMARTLGTLEPPVPTPDINAKLAEIDDLLSDQTLERQGLPPRIPLPWPSASASINADTFKRHLEALTGWISALQRIVDDGVAQLVRQKREFTASGAQLTGPQEKAFGTALRDLDQLAETKEPPAAAVLPGLIEAQLGVFNDSLVAAGAVISAGALGGSGASTRSPQALRMRIALNGMFAWGFIGVVTALAGAYVLILSNTGFGTPLDLLSCLLWGLGLPAGTLLASTTTGSIATTFSVTR